MCNVDSPLKYGEFIFYQMAKFAMSLKFEISKNTMRMGIFFLTDTLLVFVRQKQQVMQ